jgi:hypothetical protein
MATAEHALSEVQFSVMGLSGRRRQVVAQETIDTETLREMLDRGQPVTVLDIRPAEERAE